MFLFRVTPRYFMLIAALIVAFALSARSQEVPPTLPSVEGTAMPDAAETAAVAEMPDDVNVWMTRVDRVFAEYLVAPLVKVLMFDVAFGRLTESTSGEVIELPFIVIWLFVAASFLTLRMRFINIRAFRHAIDLVRGKYDDPSEPGEVTHFQALASALSATVGLGNIGGVAIAIGLGGPGAALWMAIVGLLGMTSKFTECSLAVMYRQIDERGHILGGPMRYLSEGLRQYNLYAFGKVLAVVFAVLCVGASFGGGNAYQVGQSLGVLQESRFFWFLKDYPIIYGLLMATLVGLVIVGGIKSIGNVAARIVPLMCAAYVAITLFIIATHYDDIPDAIELIFREAFQPAAIVSGGFIGVFLQGVRRAVFSNEAGVGSAAIAHSAAKTDEPISEGIVALLEPFIDTVVVCSLTAMTIVITGVYQTPEGRALIGDTNGAGLTRLAFIEGGYLWFAYVLYACVFLFAFSTCISWSYYGERSFVALFGVRSSWLYKTLFLIFTVLGSIVSKGNILDFSDLMLLAMSLPNLLGVYLMSNHVARELSDYWSRYQAGELEPEVKYDR